MADGVARSPSRLCSRDGKICCYGDALSTIFLLVLVPCFLLLVLRCPFFSFLIFFPCIPVCLSSLCPFVCAATICYSQQVRILQYVFFLLVSSYPTPSRNSFVFYSSSFLGGGSQLLFLGWRFFCCDLLTLILQRLVFICLTVCDHIICISLG